MLVKWSQVLMNDSDKKAWQQFVDRKLSARQLDKAAYYSYPTVKTLVNKFGVERLRDLARKALGRRS